MWAVCVGMEQQGKLVVCVSVVGTHCLKIKGLRSKALTAAVWRLHVLGYGAQRISLLESGNLKACQEMCKTLSNPKLLPAVMQCILSFSSSRLFLFFALTDHVNWRCGENSGWDPGVYRISKGKNLSFLSLPAPFCTSSDIINYKCKSKVLLKNVFHNPTFLWQLSKTTFVIVKLAHIFRTRIKLINVIVVLWSLN